MDSNPQKDLVAEFVQYTNRNIFLTGKAGTGKTTLLHNLRTNSFKRLAVVAPTGVAAINARGVTMHSFFQLPFGPFLAEKLTGVKNPIKKINKEKKKILKTLDLLVIDEISMVRADVLDAVDETLRLFRDRNLPFGGVQLLMIGDIQQLAPVIKDEEWSIVRKYYKTPYFFSSNALKEAGYECVELKHVYRQSDPEFVNILNEIRDNKISERSLEILNKRYDPGFQKNGEDYITLTTHNYKANNLNSSELNKLTTPELRFMASVTGKFPEYNYPTDMELSLKVGSQVMFVKNDSSPNKRFYNGKIGVITDISDEKVTVECKGDSEPIVVEPETWENISYAIDEETLEMKEKTDGEFTQLPLRLAWAITIHKSQGLTFEKAVIDAASSFAHGQAYVALSRCRSLEGMVLSSKLHKSSIIQDNAVTAFNNYIEDNQPDKEKLEAAQLEYKMSVLKELFLYDKLLFKMNALIRELQTHYGAVSGDILDVINSIKGEIENGPEPVVNKFMRQLSRLIEGKDASVNERIKKGAEYFYAENEKIISGRIKDITFATDNKNVDSKVKEFLSDIKNSMAVKRICLKYCINNDFEFKEYIQQRAKAIIKEFPVDRKPRAELSKVESKHPALFKKLADWRAELSEKKDIASNTIVTIKVMKEISDRLPLTKLQLQNIRGFGKVTMKKYGDEIFKIVKEFCNNQGGGVRSEEENYDTPEVETDSTYVKTFKKYLKGKSIAEIADERGLSVGTISSHLCRFVEYGNLDAREVLGKEKYDRIFRFFKTNMKDDSLHTKPVFEYFKGEYSYDEIRIVATQIKFMKEMK